ncbi:2-polyprenyl-6-methoxyphenol hydroxylase-like FAD-dependent oxidoreductase [Pseudomonas sp. F-14 TE3623]
MTIEIYAATPNSMTVAPLRYDCDVAIVGAGPVGSLLAILLARQGHRVHLVERWPQPYDRPRAVTFDHEIARILAILGIDSDNDPAIEYHDDLYYWRNAAGEDLQLVDWKSTSASGWRVRYWFHQPALERRLLDIVHAMPQIHLLRGWEANELTQDDAGIWLSGKTNDEVAPTHLRARYVVGADGANSFVRDKLGLSSTDRGFFYDWLILDMIPKTPRIHDPVHWQLCDPQRPTTIVPGGPGRLRWEFMALPGEISTELADPVNAWRLLEPWDVTPENATLERSAVYRFQARLANNWRNGRGVIAGDAAHLMPPFAGEGMCAGLRDAVALSWRLDAILRGIMQDTVLDSYTCERREHAKHYLEFSMALGRIICITDDQQAAIRDERMKLELEASGRTPLITDKVALGPGAWCAHAPHCGELSVQGIVLSNGRKGRFDEIVGRGWLLLCWGMNPVDALNLVHFPVLEALQARQVHIGAPGSNSEVVDVDGTYAAWFESLGACYLLIRPDFYVAGCAASPKALQEQLELLAQRLGLHQSPKGAVLDLLRPTSEPRTV